MVQLVCQCLNVHINCPGPLPRIALKLNLSKEQQKNQFFINGCTETRLKRSDIIQQIPCLCSHETLEDWIIHHCLNCNIFTHAVHASKGHDRVLVSKTLISDRNSVETLKQSPEYSAAFGLILNTFKDNYAIANVHTDNPVVKAASESIDTNFLRYLKNEEDFAEKRIQSFSENVRKEYAIVREKASHDKEALIVAISKCAQLNLEQSLQSAADNIADLSIGNKNVNEIFSAGQRSSLPFVSNFTKSSPVSSVEVPRRRTAFHRHQSVPSSGMIDDMFTLEGLDENPDPAPYYQSDDDIDTDESSLNDENSCELGSGPPPHLYASSLPVSMPGFQESRSRHSSEEDEQAQKIPVPVDPSAMAASIKALAMSVSSNGTEMFGELPGHKMKTADIALSRITTFGKK